MLACFKTNPHMIFQSGYTGYFGGSTSGNLHITSTLFLNTLSKFVLCHFALFNVSDVFEPATSKTPCVMQEGCAVVIEKPRH